MEIKIKTKKKHNEKEINTIGFRCLQNSSKKSHDSTEMTSISSYHQTLVLVAIFFSINFLQSQQTVMKITLCHKRISRPVPFKQYHRIGNFRVTSMIFGREEMIRNRRPTVIREKQKIFHNFEGLMIFQNGSKSKQWAN